MNLGVNIAAYARPSLVLRSGWSSTSRWNPEVQTWGHSVDPDNPLRVWYFAQISGTMTKDWDVNGQFFPATNKPIQSAPEAHSIEWTADGKVRCEPHSTLSQANSS